MHFWFLLFCFCFFFSFRISEAIKKADEHIKTPGKEGLMLSISQTLNDMDAYEKLTDSILDRIICSTDENLNDSREILTKIQRRQLYKYVGHILPRSKLDKKDVMQKYVEILKKCSRLTENDVAIDVVDLNYGMKDKNPIDHARFYKKDNPNVAIEIKKEEVSDLLPEKFAEQKIRFYCKKDDEESLKQAKQALTDWCKENECSVASK